MSLCAPAADGYRHDGYPPLTATAAATATHPTARVRLVSLKTDGDLMDVAALIAENDGPRQLLASQPVIEQAKGILMGHCRITDDTAFELLRRWSQDSNTKIRHIAELLTASARQWDR